ncbi:FtsQ-type POTRA domain-containing protein [Microbacterium sp. H83]|uniref:FtsQ-type POTRA domain-containing protein n=1 Tax=Microbacterium sp. H83 TaxID=1827324 RepID=UPI0007F36A28|nr:FtsQ-type POTRA domain-containing protein [Microbacterium sp. H83]OAN38454.1 cell division protein [Microbacterium sp. H83]
MRRPPPPPTPPPGVAERDTGSAGRTAPRRDRGAGADPGPRDRVEGRPLDGNPAPAADDGEHPTSTRDVWRAARARRKALRAEIRRFTQRSRRRRMVMLGALGVAVVIIGGSVAAAYSPLFAVERITVVGATTLDASAVESALSDQVGTPLALVDSSEVKAALLAFPLIETYALEAKPPHDLTVRIVERTPIGVLRSDAGYTLVDAAGVALATTSDQPAGQPLLDIDGGIDSAAFESAGLVVRSLPADVRAALTGVTATTADDVTLTLSTGLTVVWGSSDDSPLKSATLAKTLVARPDASTIDVTSPEVAVVG